MSFLSFESLKFPYFKTKLSVKARKKGNAKQCSNYRTTALISHASKVMLKILQARLQQYVNHELPDVQVGFRKGRGPRDQLPTSMDHKKVYKQKTLESVWRKGNPTTLLVEM